MTRMRKPRPLIATRQQNSIPAGKQSPQPDTANRQAQADPEQTIAQIQSLFCNSADLQIHRFQAFPATIACALLYLRSIINMEELNQTVLYPLLQQVAAPGDMADLARSLPHAGTKEGTTIQDAAQAIISGEVVLLVSGLASALFIPLKKYEQRSVTEPENEKVVRGPRDGFIESL
ncbi:MAG: spore germination protein, partial [Desulfitobacteriaceae bacterium]|nr:spore germination protein [Desulfitobacteriaceae bacterium]MDI6880929.1 spore germination protein [Desulfitobacteriaceae bacterium]MDI6915750.1 spore germination protein [Desulfitobacteriaceae bacterium]